MQGFFAAYLTGRGGMSVVLFVIKDGHMVGVDIAGMKYDGEFRAKADGTGFTCEIAYTIPPGVQLITGSGPVATPTDVRLTVNLPTDFANGPVIGIDTVMGPLNARFVKLRDL